MICKQFARGEYLCHPNNTMLYVLLYVGEACLDTLKNKCMFCLTVVTTTATTTTVLATAA